MSHHNYTNPAFCQQSEFYPTTPTTTPHNQSLPQHRHQTVQQPPRVHRSISMRSVNHHQQPRHKVALHHYLFIGIVSSNYHWAASLNVKNNAGIMWKCEARSSKINNNFDNYAGNFVECSFNCISWRNILI